MQAFDALESLPGVEADVHVQDTLLSVCLASGESNLASKAYESMRSQGLRPMAQTYENMILQCLRNGRFEHAAELAQDALVAPHRPMDATIMKKLLCALARRAHHMLAPLLEPIRAAELEIGRGLVDALMQGAASPQSLLHKRRAQRQNWRDFNISLASDAASASIFAQQ